MFGEHMKYPRRFGAAAQRCHCSRAVFAVSYLQDNLWRRAAEQEQGQGSHSSAASSDITPISMYRQGCGQPASAVVPAKAEHDGWRAGVDSVMLRVSHDR